jgi:fibronectin-binding autotransporter adhesin
MKPRSTPLFRATVLAAFTIALSPALSRAAIILKADNSTDLVLADSWVGGVVPGAADIATWDATVTTSSATLLGGALSLGGIALTQPAGPVTLGGTSTLTLGTGGVDLSTATQNLSITAPVTLANGRQVWRVAPGRTLSVAAIPNKPTQPNGVNAGVLEVATTGTVVMGSATNNLIIDPGNNPFVTLGKNDWAALNAGTVVASTYTDAETALVGGAVNDIKANLTGANATDVQAIRFNATTPFDVTVANSATSRTMTARGILVTENSAGGSIGANLNFGGFVRPNRVSTAGAAFPIIQHSTADFTIGAVIGNASSNAPVRLVKSGSGPLILLANNGYSGGTFVDAGTLRFGNGGSTGFPGGGDIINHGSLVFNRADSVTLIHNISGTGSLTQHGPGELALTTSVSTFTGPVRVTGGVLAVTTPQNLGNGSLLEINGGEFRFLQPFDASARSISFGAAGATLHTGGHTVTFANPIGNGSPGKLTKAGTGSLTLAAASNFSGGTAISGGALVAANPTGSATGTGVVTVENGGTLAGTGSIAGAVAVQPGGSIAPGEGTGTGTLTLGSLALQTGSLLNFEFSSASAHDKIAVSSAGGLSISGGSVRLTQTGTDNAFTSPGTYPLISYSGALTGSASSLSVANPQPGITYTFTTSGDTLSVTLATSGVFRNWTLNGSGSWDDAANWNGTVPNAIGATVNFDTALSAPATITLAAPRTVGSLSFTSATHGYTLAASGSGSLTLNNGSSQSNMINAAGSHTISAPITLATSTTASVPTAADTLTLGGMVSGTGSLTKTGAGSLALLAANTFSGGLLLQGGNTTFISGGLGSGALSLSNARLTWAPGNTQDISNRSITFTTGTATLDTGTNRVVLASAIGNSGEGTLEKRGSGTLVLAGNATHLGGTLISEGTLQLGNGGSTGSVEGNITNNAALVIHRTGELFLPFPISGTGTLTKNGSGELVLAAANTFTGDTVLNAGTLTLMDPDALRNSTLDYSAGTLDFGSLFSATLGGLSGNKDLVLENEFGDPLALNIGTNGQPTIYDGSLSGTGSFTKAGAGQTILFGDHTYTGATNVTGGILQLDETASIQGAALTISGNSRLSIRGGSLTATSLSNLTNAGTVAPVFELIDGSADFPGGFNALGNQNSNYLFNLLDGTFSAASMSLGRSNLNIGAEPAEGSNIAGLILNGASATIAGPLNLGVVAAANSSVSTRINSGSLTVHGPLTVGLNNGGRWSLIDVNGGTLDCTDESIGLSLGGPAAGNSLLLVRSGVADISRIQMGQGELGGSGVVHLNGGSLFIGAGGIVPGSTGAFTSTIRLRAGVLGASADWATSLPVTLAAASPDQLVVIQASNKAGAARHITLDGPVTGTGGIWKTGGGTLTLAGGHAFDGDLTVDGGTVSLVTATLADTADVSIAAGATLHLAFAGTDQVASLTLNGTAVSAGTWGSLSSNATNKSASLTGPGLLAVGSPSTASPFDSWAASFGLTGEDAAPGADPDKDGRSNLLEFAFDESPISGNQAGKSRTAVANVEGQNLWVLTLPVRDGAIFSGSHSKSATVDGITYTIQGSNDLSTYDQVVSELVPAASAGLPAPRAGWSYRSFRLEGPVGGPSSRGPRGFLRAGAQQAN